MARFEIKATIVVEGDFVRDEDDALNELQVMLNDYEDNNGDTAAEIIIKYE